MMRLILRGHPVKRMAERGVTEEQIRATLLSPDTTMPGDNGGRCYQRRFPDGRTLKVWLVQPMSSTDTSVIVKSAAWR